MIRKDPDPHDPEGSGSAWIRNWFGSQDPDPHPHWGIKLDSDTHWKPCGSAKHWREAAVRNQIFWLFTGRKWGRKWNLGNLGRVYEERGEWWRLWWRQWRRRRLHEQPRQQASQRADGRHPGQGSRDTGIAKCRVADSHSIRQKYEVIFDFCYITVVCSYFVRYGYPVTV